ncbi:MAG: MG2 domain-containing protein [Bacteroides sp.]|nr:MG2 domain-containing protein [Bacteroides sp.]
MKVKLFFTLTLLVFTIKQSMYAQSYTELWKEVEALQKQDFPQSIIEKSEQIYQKALREENAPEKVKAVLYLTEYRNRLSQNSYEETLREMEELAETATNPIEKAIWHSLLAEKYGTYLARNQWQLARMRDLAGEVPEDIREWSSNLFFNKIKEHILESLKDFVLLMRTDAKSWAPVVEKGESSRYFANDMYHLLSQRAINTLENIRYTAENLSLQTSLSIEDAFSDSEKFQHLDITPAGEYDAEALIIQLYQQALALYKEVDNPAAQVLTDLSRLSNFQRFYPIAWTNGDPESGSAYLYISTLNRLIEQYGPVTPVTAEVYLEKATFLSNSGKKEEALAVVREAVKRYPTYNRITALENMEKDILAPFLNFRFAKTPYPDQASPIQIYYKNLKGFTLEYYKATPQQEEALKSGTLSKAESKPTGKPVRKESFTLEPTADYQQKDTIVYTTPPATGNWIIVVTPEHKELKKECSLTTVTTLEVFYRQLPDNRAELLVIDSRSGHPVPGATVTLAVYNQGTWKEVANLTTDSNGKAFYRGTETIEYMRATKEGDQAMNYRNLYWNRTNSVEERTRETVTLLTDRSVYRPGQVVYVKGIAYRQQGETAEVISGKEYTLTLRNVNNQEVTTQTVSTNDFGSFDARFTLPASTLNGMYSLETPRGSTMFRVESYKRPTFTLTMESPTESYQLGDSIHITGEAKTYSGVPIKELPVKYSITRTSRIGWRMIADPVQIIVSGEVFPDDTGKFSIPVDLTPGTRTSDFMLYSYQIEATLTNESGETQSNSISVLAGNRSIILGTDSGDEILKDDSIRISFTATNPAGKPVEVEGTYSLYLKGKEEALLTDTFISNRKTNLPRWQSLPSGAYQLKMEATDERGRKVTFEKEILLYSLHDRTPPVTSPEWFKVVKAEYSEDAPATILFGTSQEDVVLYYDVFSKDRVLDSRIIRLSNSVERFDFPLRPEYGEELFVTFLFMKEGIIYMRSAQLTRKQPSRELKLKWEVFRDQLRPGSQEEWKLTITNPDKTPARAEMLALMYDASLDKIYQRSQRLERFKTEYYFNNDWRNLYNRENSSFYFSAPYGNNRIQPLTYNRLLTLMPEIRIRGAASLSRLGGLMTDMAEGAKQVFMTGAVNSMEPSGEAVEVSFEEEAISDDSDAISITPRQDFSETAFFYPHLLTNEKGEVVIAFTLPESLTEWSFQGYAHTRDMLTGMISASATASKEFMVTPNMPRFIRVADEVTLTSGITNLTAGKIEGTATMELFNPETEKVIRRTSQPFAVEAGKTTSVTFAIQADGSSDLIGCRIVASGNNFSDGEQHLIPVLSNKEMITESVLVPLREEGDQTISLTTLFNNQSKTATDKKLTVEFTTNPIWYAIQALPTLDNPTGNNAVAWASAFYANTLAAWIVEKHPAIRHIVEIWKISPATRRETLLSNLMKNEELKNILIEESPWLLDAQSETEQKERLALLFDLNTINSNNNAALEKLAGLQLPGGGWRWYQGMNESLPVTWYVLNTLVRIPELTGTPLPEQARRMQDQALTYLHNRALAEYQEITKREKSPSTTSLQAFNYLYLVTLSGEAIPQKYQEAYNYFLNLLPEELPVLSLWGKATAAIVLYKNGKVAEAQRYLASLKEYLIKSDEMGIYSNQPVYSYFGGNQKIETHVRMMEALYTLPGNEEYLEGMQVWLLKQKQTRAWNTPVNSVNAIYALLKGASGLTPEDSNIRIQVGNVTLNTREGEIGTGYIQRTFDTPKVVNSREIRVRKEGKGVAWGAVYAQYKEETSRLSPQGSGIEVKKQLYVEEINGQRREITPVSSETLLSVGDKVTVRITLTTDRDLDFVQLKDARGGCFEPLSSVSGYQYGAGTGYYVEVKDAATHFFFDSLRKGVYILEYSYYVNRSGKYEAGIASLQSAYAPEFVSHSNSLKVIVK